MAYSRDQKIEIVKILVGVIIAAVGGLWTYTTYTESQRNSELQTIIELGDAIAGMRVTCKEKFHGLAGLANATDDKRKIQCYEYFQDAYRGSLSAEIIIKKPFSITDDEWSKQWKKLQSVISDFASSSFNSAQLSDAWNTILVTKGLKPNPEPKPKEEEENKGDKGGGNGA